MSQLNTDHAKGPIRIGRDGSIVSDDQGAHVAGGDHVDYYGGYLVAESITPSNARRLVACWNAFDGIPTEKIEGRKVVATLKKMKRLADGGDWLRKKAGVLLECVETLKEHLPYIPDANCRCHAAPPCGDCVKWSGLREAIEIIDSIEKDLYCDSPNQ